MATQIAPTADEPRNLPALTPEAERFALRQRQAKMFAMSPLVPEHLRKGPPEQAIANCWIALTLAEAMGEVPLIVMQNIHVVKGKAGFASQYMIARANSSGVFKGRIDWRIDRSDAKNLSVEAYALLKETEKEVAVRVDMKMAEAEGWTQNPKYKTMPEVMLRYRSAAFLVRFYCPDVMLGYQTSEELEDVTAAALPANEPLSSEMLIEQSRPSGAAEEAAEETIDEETGEIISGTVEERPDDADPGEAIEQHSEGFSLADEIGLDEPHPGIAKADALIAEVNEANAIIDINSIIARHRDDLEAMLEDDAGRVNRAATARKAEILAAREAATAK